MEIRLMTIPDYQSTMLPLLKFAKDQQEHSIREAVDSLADYFKLTEEDKRCRNGVKS